MQVNLRVLAGPYKSRVFSFTQPDTFLIGRSNDAHLCLTDDKFFSRHHCLLEINPPHCFLRDLGSTNGTFVNGQRVSEAFLQNGAQIQGGETVLLVEVSTGQANASASSAQTEPSARPTVVTVACLNCGRREEAQATSANEHLTFLCEDCRIELKKTPQPIPGYDMVRVLGRGGMGCVMLGRNQTTGGTVAIKTLLPEFAVSDKHMRRFLREMEVAAALKRNPKDTDALLQRAELRLQSGKPDEAETDVKEVLHFKADSAQAHFVLAEKIGAVRIVNNVRSASVKSAMAKLRRATS